MDNQSLVSKTLCPRNDYDSNDIPEMPWLDCDTVNCNCSKFPHVGSVIVTTEHFVQNGNADVDSNLSDQADTVMRMAMMIQQ